MSSRHSDAAAAAQQRHEAPVDADDMMPSLGTEMPETEAVEEEGEPRGANFA